MRIFVKVSFGAQIFVIVQLCCMKILTPSDKLNSFVNNDILVCKIQIMICSGQEYCLQLVSASIETI